MKNKNRYISDSVWEEIEHHFLDKNTDKENTKIKFIYNDVVNYLNEQNETITELQNKAKHFLTLNITLCTAFFVYLLKDDSDILANWRSVVGLFAILNIISSVLFVCVLFIKSYPYTYNSLKDYVIFKWYEGSEYDIIYARLVTLHRKAENNKQIIIKDTNFIGIGIVCTILSVISPIASIYWDILSSKILHSIFFLITTAIFPVIALSISVFRSSIIICRASLH